MQPMAPARLPATAVLAALALLACQGGTESPVAKASATRADSVAPLKESWMTTRDTLDNIDSPAVWHGPGGEHWVLSTAKATDVLVVNDAATGAFVRRVGASGTGRGQMQRPNGIAIAGDLAFVVERDNHRVQAFRLPGFESLGTFAEKDLRLPYGIALHAEAADRFLVYVTDNYEMADESVPPDSLLGERVRQYRVTVTDAGLRAEPIRAFGETSGPGVLKVVESIALDLPHQRLLIAEELETASDIKVYTPEGKFTGEIIGKGLFPHQAEGIILYACGDTAGYWVTTDQGMTANTFHVFDRETLHHVGSFRGDSTRNTDGIALTQRGFGNFPSGAFYAVHNDGNVAAFSWAAIADALGLRKDCGFTAGAGEPAS
ncbi:MAG TPA: phytase [Gemmatimonadales bacterium]